MYPCLNVIGIIYLGRLNCTKLSHNFFCSCLNLSKIEAKFSKAIQSSLITYQVESGTSQCKFGNINNNFVKLRLFTQNVKSSLCPKLGAYLVNVDVGMDKCM